MCHFEPVYSALLLNPDYNKRLREHESTRNFTDLLSEIGMLI